MASLPTVGAGPSAPSGGAVSWWLSGGISAANCIAAYQPKGAASQAASYVNLANPGTYDAGVGVAPAWASGTGWTFTSGSGTYLTTGISPVAGYSMAVRFGTMTHVDFATAIGSDFSTDANFYMRNGDAAGKSRHGYGDNSTQITTDSLAECMWAITAQGCYKNGVLKGAFTPAWGATTTPINIGSNDNLIIFWSGQFLAGAIYNVDITAYLSDLTIAMNAL